MSEDENSARHTENQNHHAIFRALQQDEEE